jgi:4-hydroxy-tetrahydrodipicolinate synthase
MFRGVFTALVTPFTPDGGRVDLAALRRHTDRQIQEGVNGLVPTGTTGESPTLDVQETLDVIRCVVEQAKGRVPVIAGTGSNSTDKAMRLTAEAKKAGVAASLQVAPYYNRPTPEGLYRHFTAIADAVDLPMIVYNIPGRTGRNIDNSTMLRLAAHRNIVGVKEASGDMGQIMDLLRTRPQAFAVLSGDDNLAFPVVALGGDGVVSVASNVVPGRMGRMIRAAIQGDIPTARAEHFALLPLFRALFLETNPIPVKAALAMRGEVAESYRLPLCPMSPEARDKLASALRDFVS